jgi:hypothetical protein
VSVEAEKAYSEHVRNIMTARTENTTRNAFLAGHASRDAEVAALEAEVETRRAAVDDWIVEIIEQKRRAEEAEARIREAKAEALEEGWDAAVSASRYSYENTNWWVNPYRSGTTTEGNRDE